MTTPQDLAAQIEALAPCPFCGGKAERKRFNGMKQIACKSCLSGTALHADMNSAIAAWNTRPAIVAAIRQGEEGVVNEADEQASQDAWSDFEDDYLSDGNGGWLDVKIVFACSAAFQEAWPKGRSEAFAAALACIPIPQVAACPAPPPAPDERDDEVRRLKAQLERIGKFVDDYKSPWGSWKTAWWEGEVSDNAAFSDDNALMHVANLSRAALSPAEGGE